MSLLTNTWVFLGMLARVPIVAVVYLTVGASMMDARVEPHTARERWSFLFLPFGRAVSGFPTSMLAERRKHLGELSLCAVIGVGYFGMLALG